MPLITIQFDADRPVIPLFVSQDALAISLMKEQGVDVPPPVEARFLVDTGATMTKIELGILQELGLSPVPTINERNAFSGLNEIVQDVYAVNLFMPGMMGGVLATELLVTSASTLQGLRVNGLLGRDILDRCHLFYNGPEKQLCLAFDPPPPP